ncbi:hypothetical protein SNEBB_000418 [Seison nebaliae]|nr:hypothetical protein SNEBB_000418 [Seison nebaliae]
MKILLIIISIILELVNGLKRNGFEKSLDHSNIIFPPIVSKQYDIPEGHLRPVGWQRRPDRILDNAPIELTSTEFLKNYVKKRKPNSFMSMFQDAPVIQRWTDEFLIKNYGDEIIQITEKKEQKNQIFHYETFKEFLDYYRTENIFLQTVVPHKMYKDIPFPLRLLYCPIISEALTQIKIWMSAGESSSLVNYYSDSSIHCVISGRKDFIVFTNEIELRRNAEIFLHTTDDFYEHQSKYLTHLNPHYQLHYEEKLDMFEKYHKYSGSGYADINVDMVNAFKYEKLSEMQWHYLTLNSGDCIYIPSHQLYHVRSYGRSLSFSYDWREVLNSTTDQFQCNKTIEEKLPSFLDLEDSEREYNIKTLFTSYKGHRILRHTKNWRIEDTKNFMKLLFIPTNDLKKNQLEDHVPFELIFHKGEPSGILKEYVDMEKEKGKNWPISKWYNRYSSKNNINRFMLPVWSHRLFNDEKENFYFNSTEIFEKFLNQPSNDSSEVTDGMKGMLKGIRLIEGVAPINRFEYFYSNITYLLHDKSLSFKLPNARELWNDITRNVKMHERIIFGNCLVISEQFVKEFKNRKEQERIYENSLVGKTVTQFEKEHIGKKNRTLSYITLESFNEEMVNEDYNLLHKTLKNIASFDFHSKTENFRTEL